MAALRIKICGITRAQDARAASQAGADFIGLNFHPASTRYVGHADPAEPGGIATLLAAVEPPAVAVAVTVNSTKAELNKLIAAGPKVGAVPFRVIQLHGDEPPALADYLIERQVKVIKAFAVADAGFAAPVRDWLAKVRRPAGLLAVLLDAAVPSGRAGRRYGGTGRRFNWEWIAQAREAGELAGWPPLMLAGGLSSANVAKAIRIAQPWGVDVAGGVEVEDSPGIKSVDRIRSFIRSARVG